MYKKLIRLFRWVVSLGAMFIAGIFCVILVYGSFGLLRNFSNRYIVRNLARGILRVFGYSYSIPDISEFPQRQVMYTINHNSYLDIFLLTGIGLPNTRFILSEVTLKFIPMVIMAKAVGTRYIPQKFRPKRRMKFFLKTTEFLKKTNNSVFASPEGVRAYKHGIYPFNKGIFHMAMEAEVPIVPLFLYIPEEMNPYKGQFSKTGRVELHILDMVDNSGWKLENIREEIDRFRNIYVDHFNKVHHTNIE